jgi:GDP-L-fucose synthase
MADACVFLMSLPDEKFDNLLGSDESRTGKFEPPLINIGVGKDITIRELAGLVKEVVGYKGEISFDTTKPDGTPRKLMDVSRLLGVGWSATTGLRAGLSNAYQAMLRRLPR